MQLGKNPQHQLHGKHNQFITPLPNKSYHEPSQNLSCQLVPVEMAPSLLFAVISFVKVKNHNINHSFTGEIGVLNTND
jgi:hypothetical protein